MRSYESHLRKRISITKELNKLMQGNETERNQGCMQTTRKK
jgi:hypothetical protein